MIMRLLYSMVIASLLLACEDEPATLDSDTTLDTRVDEVDSASNADTREGDTAPQTDTAEPPDTGAPDTGSQDTTLADTGGEDTPDTAAPDVPQPCEAPRIHGDAPPLAEVNACGALSYGRYAAEGQSNAEHILPDFSWAGYRGGGVALPTVAVVRTVSPGDGDDRQRIQDAIDAVSAEALSPEGFRGAVQLEAGTYEVGDTLLITSSGVVLRGAGQGTNGTVLVATRREQHDLIRVEGSAGLREVSGSRVRITTPYVAVGSTRFEVEDASGFQIGDEVGVVRTPNTAWIQALGMDAWGWTASSYEIEHERRIVDIAGNTVEVDIPIVDAMEAVYGGGALFVADVSGRVEQVGIEDLRIVSEYTGGTDEAHAWVAVKLRRAAHSWVRRVTAQHLGYAAVSLERQSSFNTVEDCAMLAPISQVTGGRRYSFNVGGGTANLFQRCYSEEARHDFVTGSRVGGPNVWLDCLSVRSFSDDGPHHRWSTGLLFDNVSSRFLNVENRQDSGSGHGWSGAQVLFWNAVAEGIRSDAPLGAMNWTVGVMGEQREGGWTTAEPFGIWESHGTPVEPRSLYLKQLEDRLGADAVNAVTLPAQRSGRIWDVLASWAGDGRIEDVTVQGGDPSCATGLASGSSCCEAGCGSCGGTGCGGRPGGADACCGGSIATSGRSCAVYDPPCIVDPSFAPVGTP